GKMQKTSGNTIFTPVLAAASSARWRRLVLSVSECTRSDCATLVPNLSVCTSIATSELTSSTPVRSARFFSASTRFLPARSSRLPISEVDFGTMLPSFFRVSTTFFSYPNASSAPLSGVPVTSPRRRSIALELGDNAIAAAAMMSDAKTNARSGSKNVTLHLDLDDLADPDIANHLHDDCAHQQLLAQLLIEQQVHVS